MTIISLPVFFIGEKKMLTQEQYNKAERSQTIHRTFNTILGVGVLAAAISMINPVIESNIALYEKVSGITEQKVIESEIAQIASDESYRRCVYDDSLGKATIGFGHLMIGGEEKVGKCITPESAIKMLRSDYSTAREGVIRNYPWAEGETRLILTNMTFQLGNGGVSKFKNAITAFNEKEYDTAAAEMIDSKWCVQTTNRCARLVGRTMALKGE